MMLNRRTPWPFFLIILFCFCFAQIALAHISHMRHSRSALEREAVERLVATGYLSGRDGAQWAAAQGPRIVPVLEDMLPRYDEYFARFDTVGDFPDDVLWALAHINTPRSLRILQRFYDRKKDDTASLAIQGFQLRRKHSGSWDYGVLIADRTMRAAPSEKARGLRQMKEGEPIKILKQYLVIDKEEGPRGGPAVYDYVRSLRTGKTGYIQRAGDDFESWM